MECYHKKINRKTYIFPMITNAPFDNTNVDFYGSLKKLNNCGIFHLFSMYWYCIDHQICPSSYDSWQDLFNSKNHMKIISRKKTKVFELSKKNRIVFGQFKVFGFFLGQFQVFVFLTTFCQNFWDSIWIVQGLCFFSRIVFGQFSGTQKNETRIVQALGQAISVPVRLRCKVVVCSIVVKSKRR